MYLNTSTIIIYFSLFFLPPLVFASTVVFSYSSHLCCNREIGVFCRIQSLASIYLRFSLTVSLAGLSYSSEAEHPTLKLNGKGSEADSLNKLSSIFAKTELLVRSLRNIFTLAFTKLLPSCQLFAAKTIKMTNLSSHIVSVK